jgi:ADP-heptose:LPS heptosyltransferase
MKLLIIRFSSFGDVIQGLSIPAHVHSKFKDAEIHWITRSEFSEILELNPHLTKVWSLDRKLGFRGLKQLAKQLKSENFTHIYDAHNNMRSFFLKFYLHLSRIVQIAVLTRSLFRFKRFLLFRLRINTFEMPFSGQRDLLKPLEKWGIPFSLPQAPQLFFSDEDHLKAKKFLAKHFLDETFLTIGPVPSFVVLAASSAHELKRWPIEYWKKLIFLFPKVYFVLLGGLEDLFFEEIRQAAPERVFNFAGKLSLIESSAIVNLSAAVIANDTGLLHVAEQLAKPCIALMGPAPFGFPSRLDRTIILEIDLKCRPCSKHGQGPCINSEFQRCLRDIKPELVALHLKKMGISTC